MRVAFWVCMVAACYRPSATLDDAAVADDVADGADNPGEVCLGGTSGLLEPMCFLTSEPHVLTGPIDTSLDPRCRAEHPTRCVIAGSSITVETVDVSGDRPLVLWSASSILVRGMIDASSRRTGKRGPGGDKSCATPAGLRNDVEVPQVGGGGAGGTFSSAGGAGGEGRRGAATTNIVTPAMPRATPTTLVAGCRGGHGGHTSDSGGTSGGTAYLIARFEVHFDGGAIHASGAGGDEGLPASINIHAGGGGGGSGGLIGLEAPSITLRDATLVALGGGGGAGAEDVSGDPGGDGELNGGVGGMPVTGNENRGGPGCGNALAAGVGGSALGNPAGGGGGGGGGCGHVLAFGSVNLFGTVLVVPPLP